MVLVVDVVLERGEATGWLLSLWSLPSKADAREVIVVATSDVWILENDLLVENGAARDATKVEESRLAWMARQEVAVLVPRSMCIASDGGDYVQWMLCVLY